MRTVIWAIICAVFLSSAPAPLLAGPPSHTRLAGHKVNKKIMKLRKPGKLKVKKYRTLRRLRRTS